MKVFSILLIRAIAMLVLVKSLYAILPALMMPNFWQQPVSAIAATICGYVVIPVVISTLVFLFSHLLSTLLLPKNHDVIEEVSTTPSELMFVGTFLIGLYWTIEGLAKFGGQWILHGTTNYQALIVMLLAILVMLTSKKVSTWAAKIPS
ncbi:hypothetical protein EK599_21600 [Vibrio sp. T187]|uniref:hypothetical protein n=1 Tax=Vibrio TaxID=662 RepID=UPI0010C9535B|nr:MULTISPECIES: hypothetical protein [Vibrio]MBW3698273.1 hypothetical protein [Vibrio sp. T187]